MNSRACFSCISGPTTTPSSSPRRCAPPWMRWQTSKTRFENSAPALGRHGCGPTPHRRAFVTDTSAAKRGPLTELLFYFLRLGVLGFGGPVALVGQMEREVVAERGWLSKEQMREAIAICQSLPGPLAIQVGIYVGYL